MKPFTYAVLGMIVVLTPGCIGLDNLKFSVVELSPAGDHRLHESNETVGELVSRITTPDKEEPAISFAGLRKERVTVRVPVPVRRPAEFETVLQPQDIPSSQRP